MVAESAVLSASPPSVRERQFAVAVAVASFGILILAAPFARIHLPQIHSFMPAYQAALFTTDLITAALLYGQFARAHSLGLLILASAYLFDAMMIVPHTLTFPGLFAPTGLLGAGPQTTAWLYLFWHAGFVVYVLAYIVMSRFGIDWTVESAWGGAILSALGTAAIVVALVLLATLGHDSLPVIMQGNGYSLVVQKGISPAVCALSLLAIAVLWPKRHKSALNTWLAVVLCVWFCDVMLGAVVGSQRFDLGFYVGRAYGLLASCVLLAMLLTEAIGLQAELLRSQEQLAHARHFEAIGQLTGGVAHDFNNLLTVVSGSAAMIRKRPDEHAKVLQWAESILTAAERGATLTRQLLTFARRQSGNPETVNPNRLLSEFKPILEQAVGSDVEIALDLSPVIDPVRVDCAQFESAILNLVVNARDAMPTGGRVLVSTSNASIGKRAADVEMAPGDYVLVAVRDTGSGMSKEVAAKAVDPFFTTKQPGRGTGLGLSQVYGLIKSYGGHLRIESELGVGTTVTLYLPKSYDGLSHQRRPDALPMRRASGGECVLVVEDQADVLSLTRESLLGLGYKVLTACDAQEALAILRRDEQIDVLFSDIVMPGAINGAMLAVEARRLRPDIKVVLTSGYSSELLHARGLPEGADVLPKPYRIDDLAARLSLVRAG